MSRIILWVQHEKNREKKQPLSPHLYPHWGQGENNKILKSVTETVEENSVIGKNKVREMYKVCNLNKLVT